MCNYEVWKQLFEEEKSCFETGFSFALWVGWEPVGLTKEPVGSSFEVSNSIAKFPSGLLQ